MILNIEDLFPSLYETLFFIALIFIILTTGTNLSCSLVLYDDFDVIFVVIKGFLAYWTSWAVCIMGVYDLELIGVKLINIFIMYWI